MLDRKIKAMMIMVILTAIPLSLSAEETGQFGSDFAPSASPDGKQIVYYAYREKRGDLPDLYIVDIKTGIERRLTTTPGMFEIEPRWSPDGSTILFAGGPSMKELALYSIKPDGSEYQLFYDGDGSGAPNWSSDGSQMAFWLKHNDGSSDLLLLDLITGDQAPLKIDLGGYNNSPAWSPDGKKIAFAHQDIQEDGKPSDAADGNDGIYIIDIETKVTSKISNKPTNAYGLEWASTGGYIYYTSPVENKVMHVYRAPLTGGEAERVTNDYNGSAYFPAFTDNGETLLFSGRTQSDTTRIMALPTHQIGVAGRQVTSKFVN